jgi:hypothetical protein
VVGVDLGFECLFIASYRVFVKAVGAPPLASPSPSLTSRPYGRPRPTQPHTHAHLQRVK